MTRRFAPGSSAWPWLRRAVPVVVAVAVLVASVSRPPAGGPPAPTPFGIPADKLLHAATYALLAGALGVGLATPGGRLLGARAGGEPGPLGPRTRRRVALLAVVVAVGYGLAIEVLQYPLPFRTFDLLDAAANAVGATLGACAWLAGALGRRRVDR